MKRPSSGQRPCARAKCPSPWHLNTPPANYSGAKQNGEEGEQREDRERRARETHRKHTDEREQNDTHPNQKDTRREESQGLWRKEIVGS